VKLILDYSASLEVKNKMGQTPLHVCVCNSDPTTNCAELLLDRGADLDARSHCGTTPLQFAVMLGKEVYVRLFINRGSNIMTRNTLGHTILYMAAVSAVHKVNMLKVVCDCGRFPDEAYFMKDDYGRTVRQIVEAMIESWPDARREYLYAKKLKENRDYLLQREREAIMKVLVSPLTIPRLATSSIRILPKDVIRQIDKFLF
jgi:hypothetical protein